MNEKFRMRLYALTAIACAAWLVQSTMEANSDGTLLTPASIILLVCQVIAIAYTGISAIIIWLKPSDGSDSTGSDGDGKAHDDTSGHATPEEDAPADRERRAAHQHHTKE